MFLTKILKALSQPSDNHGLEFYSSILPVFDKETDVSRNLFQICLRKEGTALPVEIQNASGFLKEINPHWRYHMIDDSGAYSFILEEYGQEVLSYYERLNPNYMAARADFLRYLLLYRYGGAYIDLKCGLKFSLDQSVLESGKFPIFFWDNKPGGNHHPAIPSAIKEGEILQGFIVSPAGHPFLREVILEVMKRIDNYNPYIDGVGYGGVMAVTGPGMYTETIYNSYKSHRDQGYVAKPFADFGFILRTVNIEHPSGMTDYRRQTAPLVSSGKRWLDIINKIYLGILSKRNS